MSVCRSPDEATQRNAAPGDTVEVMAIAAFKDLCTDITGGDIHWDVLADPQVNELRAFTG